MRGDSHGTRFQPTHCECLCFLLACLKMSKLSATPTGSVLALRSVRRFECPHFRMSAGLVSAFRVHAYGVPSSFRRRYVVKGKGIPYTRQW